MNSMLARPLFPRALVALLCALAAFAAPVRAQQDVVQRIDLPLGRSYPITTSSLITRVSIASPEVADVVVITNKELVINAKGAGETDAIIWLDNGERHHYRVSVHSPADRMQVVLYVKFAEVQRNLLSNLNPSLLFRNDHVRVGTGILNNDNVFDQTTGAITLPAGGQFLSLLTDFDTRHLLAFLDVQSQKGKVRMLAEPNLIAANKENATFLAGGEIPIPVVSSVSGTSTPQVGIQYKEFGVRLNFNAEVISDSLLKLNVTPEVSNLDFSNALTISGFKIPALSTRRVSTTIDVKRDESLIISGMFNDNRSEVKTGIPFLMDVPILGRLFSSTQWQNNQTELLVIVTPVVVDPMHPRFNDTLKLQPDTALPARPAIEPRLVAPLAPRDSSPR